MKFALVNLAEQKIVRENEFDELPPLLASAKGLQWFALADEGIEAVAHDPITQHVKPDGIAISGRTVTRKYRVDTFPADAVQARIEKAEYKRVASLWQAAHDLEYNAISGSAIGLITLGVLQAKPKCLAVQGWIKSIWTEYYVRKASGSADTDFSLAGKCPHSVPELMAELGL